MLYLYNKTDAQVIFVPKNGARKESGNLSLRLSNTIDLDVIVERVVDLNTSQLYYNLSVELPEGLPMGEYRYDLMDRGNILSTGLMTIGETDKPNEYNKDIVYEQYDY